MVSLLEALLSFHSWYKYGEAPFGPDYENGNADGLLLSLHQMMARTIAYCPREDGNGWKLQELHEQLHLAIALVFFRHAQNFDAGSGERLLKDFFKKLAQTCQHLREVCTSITRGKSYKASKLASRDLKTQ
jgi:hypothetical protein